MLDLEVHNASFGEAGERIWGQRGTPGSFNPLIVCLYCLLPELVLKEFCINPKLGQV